MLRMILSGMGPVVEIHSTANFSVFMHCSVALCFILNIGIILAPAVRRIFHILHWKTMQLRSPRLNILHGLKTGRQADFLLQRGRRANDADEDARQLELMAEQGYARLQMDYMRKIVLIYGQILQLVRGARSAMRFVAPTIGTCRLSNSSEHLEFPNMLTGRITMK